MKLSLVVVGLYLTTLFIPTVSFAQTVPEQPLQELFLTETVYPQDKGETQITFGSQFSKNKGRKLFQIPLSLEYGLTDKLQMSFELAANGLTLEGESFKGPSDIELGMKYSWMNIGRSNFHMATGLELGLPTGSVKKNLGEGELEYEPYIIIAKDFPHLSRLQLFSQFGVTLSQPVRSTDDDDEFTKGMTWNNGLFVAFRQMAFTTELNWQKSGGENTLYVTPGIVWTLPHSLEMGFGVPIGITKSADRYRTIMKLTYEFGGSNKSDEPK
jgi:hypothetical protein